jgi:FdrA protein
VRPRTLAGGLGALPGATLALISVPGVYAGAEARRALDAGLHVMLFSDNVSLATEVELKRVACQRGLFLMGPDCGSAIVAGVPLGFANVVPRGRIGIVAASGTGLQEVSCRLAAEGEGVSHAIGVGGRDMADATTEVVIVIGKLPGDAVATRLAGALAGLGKPSVVAVGTSRPAFRSTEAPPLHVAQTLEDAARAAVALARGRTPPRAVEFSAAPEEIERLVTEQARALAPGQRFVRGVYAGGTLALEAAALLSARLPEVAPGVRGGGAGHRVIDLGDDGFTLGRPHPMIDGAVRREWIEREAADPGTAVLLLDVILGHGAHPDPAGELIPALEAARRTAAAGARGLAVVASVTGTDGDPQVRSVQVATLRRAGVLVMDANAQAARLAAEIAARAPETGS